ncbi:MAG: hypothetical protein ACI9QD_000016, partial [Thermoproteota archaeon]
MIKYLHKTTSFILLVALAVILQACGNYSEGDPDDAATSGHAPAVEEFVVSITDGIYILGENIDLTFTFPYDVTVTGTPRVAVDVGGISYYANYVSGSGSTSLIFRYTVIINDLDTDGIILATPIDLNSGTLIYDTTKNASVNYTLPESSNIEVDALVATITNYNPPTDKVYYFNEVLTFSVDFDEAVYITGTPRLVVDIGGSIVYANYSTGSGSTNLEFTYTILSNELDGNGVDVASPIDLNSGTVQDIGTNNASLTFVPPLMPLVQVNGDKPVVVTTVAPANNVYLLGDDMDFTLTFSEVVNVTGTPQLQILIDAVPTTVSYYSGTGTTDLVFRYTVQPNDYDADGIDLGTAILLNSGTILDGTLNAANLLYSYVPTGGVLIDGRVPDIIAVNPPADKIYIQSENLNFTVVFDIPVDVTGAPTLDILIGATTVQAIYLSGTGGTNLIFQHTILNGQNDLDGVDSVTPLAINGGTIKSTNAVNANLVFTTTNYPLVLVDTTAPTILSVTPPADTTYSYLQDLDFIANFSENVDITGSPRIAITLATGTVYAEYLSGTGTSAITFRNTVVLNDEDTDGVTLVSPLELNSGTIKDTSLNDAVLTYTLPVTTSVFVDAVKPTITSITPPADGWYKLAADSDFVANFSENVDITGTPR